MNINLLNFETHAKTNDYLDGIFSHGFLPVISRPTRISASSATLLDHMYTNDIISSYQSGIIITDVADHFATFVYSRVNASIINTQQLKEDLSRTTT